MLGDGAQRRARAKGRGPGEHAVEHAAERVEVRPPVEGLTAGLLRRHVLGRPAYEPGDRDGGALVLDELGDPEVADLHVLASLVVDDHHDVLGLQVAVDDAVVVRLFEREEDAADQVRDPPGGEG